MTTQQILDAIDNHIAKLQQARALLAGGGGAGWGASGRAEAAPAKKRAMSDETKARMAAAQKARWAAKK